MAELQEFPLVTRGGRAGRVYRGARFLDRNQVNRVRLDDGTELEVPASALHVQPDGTFLLEDGHVPQEAVAPPAPVRVPEPEWAASSVPSPVASPAESQPLPDEMLFSENVAVERIPINRLIDGPAPVRQEGAVTIVPVVEEVLVVQKRLLLKEEVRITRQRSELREPRRVVMSGSETRVLGADGREIAL